MKPEVPKSLTVPILWLPTGKNGSRQRTGLKDKKQEQEKSVSGNGRGGHAKKKGGGHRGGQQGMRENEIRQIKWENEWRGRRSKQRDGVTENEGEKER